MIDAMVRCDKRNAFPRPSKSLLRKFRGRRLSPFNSWVGRTEKGYPLEFREGSTIGTHAHAGMDRHISTHASTQ